MTATYNQLSSFVQEKLLTNQNGVLQKLMEAEIEKNNALMNAHLREQQNGGSTSLPSTPPSTVPDSMPSLNIGPCQPRGGTVEECEPESSPAQVNSGKLPPWMLRSVSNRWAVPDTILQLNSKATHRHRHPSVTQASIRDRQTDTRLCARAQRERESILYLWCSGGARILELGISNPNTKYKKAHNIDNSQYQSSSIPPHI